ncbi:MAG: potassium transporter [Deltaproteobacteria bacterium]|nr:potassium transporter [Deltaproteobacteria bacterium]
MKTVWIIGAGKFGFHALKQLSNQHRDWHFVLVDKVKKNLFRTGVPNTTFRYSDGVRFLYDFLEPGTEVFWIIPSLPVHLAWEWCRMKMGSNRLVRSLLLSGINSLLPNPMQGDNKDVYTSNADFFCPENCSEPENICTVTKQPRKQDMFDRLETLKYKDYTPVVLRSRQLGPGIGGYRPAQLFSFLKKAEQYKGSLLLCTACRCHGVITGAKHL